MFEKINVLVKRYQDIIIYLIFGVLTTLVNFIVYFLLYNVAKTSATLSNVVAWAVAVIFAFVTNKPFVFQSKDWSLPVVVPEFCKFVGCRVGTGLLETLIILITVDILQFSGNLIKIVVSILVVILNYVASKLFVFDKKKESPT